MRKAEEIAKSLNKLKEEARYNGFYDAKNNKLPTKPYYLYSIIEVEKMILKAKTKEEQAKWLKHYNQRLKDKWLKHYNQRLKEKDE